jgi:hypothetical protein
VARTSAQLHHPRAVDPYTQADELLPEVHNALAALADLETRYETERERLERWSGPPATKDRLAALLRDRYRAEREQQSEFLAELQRRLLVLCGPRVLH